MGVRVIWRNSESETASMRYRDSKSETTWWGSWSPIHQEVDPACRIRTGRLGVFVSPETAWCRTSSPGRTPLSHVAGKFGRTACSDTLFWSGDRSGGEVGHILVARVRSERGRFAAGPRAERCREQKQKQRQCLQRHHCFVCLSPLSRHLKKRESGPDG